MLVQLFLSGLPISAHLPILLSFIQACWDTMASQSSETIHTSEELDGNVLVVGAGLVSWACYLPETCAAGIVVDVAEKESRLGEEPRAVA